MDMTRNENESRPARIRGGYHARGRIRPAGRHASNIWTTRDRRAAFSGARMRHGDSRREAVLHEAEKRHIVDETSKSAVGIGGCACTRCERDYAFGSTWTNVGKSDL